MFLIINSLLELNFHHGMRIVYHSSLPLKLSQLFILLQNMMMLLFRLLFSQMHLTLGALWTFITFLIFWSLFLLCGMGLVNDVVIYFKFCKEISRVFIIIMNNVNFWFLNFEFMHFCTSSLLYITWMYILR